MSDFTAAAAALLKEPRYITREEAEAAAAVLRACNGHDLDTWSNGEFDEEALGGMGADFLTAVRNPRRVSN
ncbi:hypothetical protein EZH22_31150 (plasmid) [Xanthobacter dioxanivorans]|uniref:Uncharacterized protein n=1 Tax=Xanthobacter dioxanivorans TaxID=2528964 RepID=A0A974PVA3_9HYPH|nr:hypothetical protein [Xanthobacter dioxanivorans]QRG10231.1 hypothetical protein EZH22_31150 [Xanthobacter dioxanivorans]